MTLERALAHLDAFLERAHPGFADDPGLHGEARALSEAYTTGRTVSAHAAGSLAYLAHFGPRAVVSSWHALSATQVPQTALDVGAGSGAASLALLVAGARRVTLVEQSATALALAERLLAGLGEIRAVPQRIEDARPVDAEILLSAFTFGELHATPSETFARIAGLAPRAQSVVLVDAGDRRRARRLQELRDTLVQEGRDILAPCPHRDRCPALMRARDWCHARHAKELPERLARFARAVGRDDVRMAASSLVVAGAGSRAARDTAPTGPTSDARARLLVIGEAHKEKGRARVPVCGPGGLRFLQALKRDRAAHDVLLDLEHGARLELEERRDRRDQTAHITSPDALHRWQLTRADPS